MNSHERAALSRFLGQLTEVRLTDKDAEAESLIREAVTRQPDAAYLLVQRAMLVEQALETAKARIVELEQARRAEATAGEGSFLRGRNPWAPPSEPAGAPGQVPGAGTYRMPSGAAAVGAAPPMGGGGSFLGNIATTAAGVVAGSFLFQGLESLLGHHHGAGSAWADSGGEQLAEQTVINNYYGTDPEGLPGTEPAQDAGPFLASDVDDGYADEGADDSDWI